MIVRALALAAIVALAVTASVPAEEPVDAFVAAADSLARSGDESGLARWVEGHPLLVGAAVAELLDRNARAPGTFPDAAALAGRIARLHLGAGGSDAPQTAVETFASWTEEDRRRREEARVLHDRADSLRTSQPSVALSIYKQILPVYQSLDDRHAIAILWGGMGVAHWYLGDLDHVRTDYERALAARRAVEDRILEGRTLNGLGTVNMQTGNLLAAAGFYSQATDLRRRTGDVSGLGTSLTYLGHVYYNMGLLDKAHEQYLEALPLLEKAGSPSQMADVTNGLANCYAQKGQHRRANRRYAEAAEMAFAAGDPRKEAHCRANLAASYQRMGRHAEALVQLARVDSLMQVVNDPELPALLCSIRGQVNVEIGALDDAREDFLAGIQAAENLPDPQYLMDALINLAYLYEELGAVDRGLETAERARALAERHGNTRKARNAIIIAANLLLADGDAGKALDYWKQALALDESDDASAMALEDRISIASLTAALDRPDEARALFYELAPEVKTPRVAVSYHLGLAHSFERENPDSAVWHYEAALSVVESSRMQLGGDNARSSFLSGDRRFYFEEVARYYASRDSGAGGPWSARAFRVIERAKARGLLDLVTGADFEEADENETNALQQLHRDKSESVVVDVSDVSAALPTNAVLLQYALGDTASMVWVVDTRGNHLEFLPPRRDIEAMVQQFRDAVRRPGAGDGALRSAAHALYRAVVEPVAPRLEDFELLVIVPDGGLHALPFDALLTEESDAAWSAQPYLARRWTTLYSPSASIFTLFARDGSDTQTYGADLVALGAPEFSLLADDAGRSLDDLPYASAEIAAISTFAAPERRDVRMGADATEARAREALVSVHPRVLHLATHGLVDPIEPGRSEIVLCPDAEAKYDGHFRVMEIASARGRAGLVVLSACESGLGKVFRGEGVVGLSRAFIAAGCRGAVVSLWPVSDESTAQLMTGFYRGMLGNRLPAVEAMRDARRDMFGGEDYAHPFYWAPFVVVGNDRIPW